jgi:phage shock protein A
VQEAVKSISVIDPSSDLGRFEDRIRRQEALARGMEEVAVSSLEDQFDELDDDLEDLAVEARLASLKAGNQPQLTAGD